MERYATAFYKPLVSDWSNFGQWTENGSLTATQRANKLWKKIVAEYEPPRQDPAIREELQAYVERRIAEGEVALDALLTEGGELPVEQVDEIVELVTRETLFELLRWTRGSFHFT